MKKFKELFGAEEFHPDCEKLSISEILEKPIILHESRILKDFNGEFGKHDAALILFGLLEDEPEPEATLYTTICSGVVLVDQIKKILANPKKYLPMETTIVLKKSGRNQYYTLS